MTFEIRPYPEFSWSISRQRKLDQCPRGYFYTYYLGWNGWLDDAPTEARVAYRLGNPVPPAQYQAQMAVGLGLLGAESCFEHRLAAIQSATLIFFGEHDQVVPPANAELLARAIPHSTVRILADAGHIWMIERPAAAVAEITRFLER